MDSVLKKQVFWHFGYFGLVSVLAELTEHSFSKD
jgi:hypothetical protein